MSRLEKSWQRRGLLVVFLWPLSLVYGVLVAARRACYRLGIATTSPMLLPVVVVGNISVGGTGKTPLCAYLVKEFQRYGWRPAIVSRGYGGERHRLPRCVQSGDTAALVGDEPLLLHQQTGVPVCVCINRAAAVGHVQATCDANIVFSDDGLQHLAMPRQAQIAVIDGTRGLGNRWLLPAGPLRDSIRTLKDVDFIAVQVPYERNTCGISMQLHESFSHDHLDQALTSGLQNTFSLQATHATECTTGRDVPLGALKDRRVHAVAGIGNPDRFFASLRALGMQVIVHPLPDHHEFTRSDVVFDDDLPVLVTSKDAVKLRQLTDLPSQLMELCVRVDVSSQLAWEVDKLQQSLRQRYTR